MGGRGSHLPVDPAIVLDPLQVRLGPPPRQQPPVAQRPRRVGPGAFDDILAPVAQPRALDDEPNLSGLDRGGVKAGDEVLLITQCPLQLDRLRRTLRARLHLLRHAPPLGPGPDRPRRNVSHPPAYGGTAHRPWSGAQAPRSTVDAPATLERPSRLAASPGLRRRWAARLGSHGRRRASPLAAAGWRRTAACARWRQCGGRRASMPQHAARPLRTPL
eukprot:scaffold103327_cov55-Phaeocystis_antarctica.AAC.1